MKKLTFAALLLIGCAPFALAQGTYTQIDPPGARATYCFSINSAGDTVAGTYYDSGDYSHGFLLSGGNYTIVNYPGATDTMFFGMNDFGQVVGTGLQGEGSTGFVYDYETQRFTKEIVYPGALLTYAYGINNAGMISGLFYTDAFSAYGFVLVGSKYSEVKPPQAESSALYGITSSGVSVGVGYISSTVNFAFGHGKYRPLEIPNAPNAGVLGVNPAGTALVGSYQPTSGVSAGFLYQNQVLQTLQFPGSNETEAYGINDAGEVVGLFVDASGVQHGFTWTPPAAEEKK